MIDAADRVPLAYAQRIYGGGVLGHLSAARALRACAQDYNVHVVHVPHRALRDPLRIALPRLAGCDLNVWLLPADLDDLPRSDDEDVVSAAQALFDLEERRDVVSVSSLVRQSAVVQMRRIADLGAYRRLVMDHSLHRERHRI